MPKSMPLGSRGAMPAPSAASSSCLGTFGAFRDQDELGDSFGYRRGAATLKTSNTMPARAMPKDRSQAQSTSGSQCSTNVSQDWCVPGTHTVPTLEQLMAELDRTGGGEDVD